MRVAGKGSPNTWLRHAYRSETVDTELARRQQHSILPSPEYVFGFTKLSQLVNLVSLPRTNHQQRETSKLVAFSRNDGLR